MAWITKDSANTQVERRAEPWLTDEMKKLASEQILPRYEVKKGALLNVLHLVQHEHGWVPAQAMEEIAEFMGITPADVLDTASFYEEYWLKRKGKHLISVCRSIACEFCGQCEVSQAIKDALNIEVGETTDDEQFTLIELECIGACGGAPAVLVDEKLHENVKPGDVDRLIQSAKENGH